MTGTNWPHPPPRTDDPAPPFPALNKFMTDLAEALGLPDGITYSRGALLDEVASLRKRADAPRASDYAISIPGPGASLAECREALTALRKEEPFPIPFEANLDVRRACAAVLEGLVTGRQASTEKVCVLRRPQAAWVVQKFKEAGWGESVWSGGICNSYPNVGELEIWSVEVHPARDP